MDELDTGSSGVSIHEMTRGGTGESRIGIAIYWLFIYAFAIGFGGLTEAIADAMSRLIVGFGSGRLIAQLRDLPTLLLVAVVFSVALTWALLFAEKLIAKPLRKTPHWFKAFTLAFVFLGSHIFYEIVNATQSLSR